MTASAKPTPTDAMRAVAPTPWAVDGDTMQKARAALAAAEHHKEESR